MQMQVGASQTDVTGIISSKGNEDTPQSARELAVEVADDDAPLRMYLLQVLELPRLTEVGRLAAVSQKQRGEGKPETFNSLGFARICGQAWKNGKFLVLRKIIRKRLLPKLKEVKHELRRRMHQPLAEVGKRVKRVVRG
jgi:hypothetical protein